MGDTIKFKKGLKENLPTLGIGEPGFTTNVDDQRMYIGGPNGNVAIPNMEDIDIINSQMNEKANNTDSSRTTTAKDVTGAINELNTNKPTVETGIWTPVLIGSITAGTNTYSVQTGRYIKEGKKITCWFRMVMSAKDTNMSGNVLIGGLPYVSLSNNANRAGLSIGWCDNIIIPNNYQQIASAINVGHATMNLGFIGSGVNNTGATSAQIMNNTSIQGSITYETDV